MSEANAAARILVAVCTFRRNLDLERLIRALDVMCVSGACGDVTVAVFDNSPEGGARDVISSLTGTCTVEVRYVYVGASNISSVRNRSLAYAIDHSFSHIALIDDDEVPSELWLSRLFAALTETGADVVCGPVLANIGPDSPSWILSSFYSVAVDSYSDRESIDEGITGNALVDLRRFANAEVWFDESLGLAGGEDQLFFRALRQAGLRIIWAADACAYERVPESRTNFSYLMRREYRKGNTLGLLDRGRIGWPVGRPYRRILTSCKWAATGTVQIFVGTIQRSRSSTASGAMQLVRSCGMVTGLLGKRYDLYAATGREVNRRVAIVLGESPYYQAAGQGSFLTGIIDHLSSRNWNLDLIITGPKVGFLVRRRDWGVNIVSRHVVNLGRWQIVRPNAGLGEIAWRIFRSLPLALQRLVGRVRDMGRNLDHHIGAPPSKAESDLVLREIGRVDYSAVFFWTIFSVPTLGASCDNWWLLTSDIMSDRVESLKKFGYRVSPDDFSAVDEALILRRVPRIVAIQWDDAKRFRELAPDADVVVVPQAVSTRSTAVTGAPRRGRVLFVGSGALPNVDGLNWFLNEVWPGIRSKASFAELHVVGTVASRVSRVAAGVVYRGEVGSLVPEYLDAAVVVVPLRVGSGLKIKIVEGISYGRAIVSTSVGAQGLLSLAPRPFALADDAESFSRSVSDLLLDENERIRLSAAAISAAPVFDPSQAFVELDRRMPG